LIDAGACFRMSVLNAVHVLANERAAHPTLDLDRLAFALQETRASVASFNFETACELVNQHPGLLAVACADRESSLRALVSAMVTAVSPGWRFLVPRGRKVVLDHADDDLRQVFNCAGLLGLPPGATIVEWWDRLAAETRSGLDTIKVGRGRAAEQWTLETERQRLLAAGRADLHPTWVGFEDNTAGYDVRSYTIHAQGAALRAIEVKSYSGSQLRFLMSRSEWDTAAKLRDSYVVHLWSTDSRELVQIEFSELEPHIPSDRGNGKWTEVLLLR
jgi:hypothetical protein